MNLLASKYLDTNLKADIMKLSTNKLLLHFELQRIKTIVKLPSRKSQYDFLTR